MELQLASKTTQIPDVNMAQMLVLRELIGSTSVLREIRFLIHHVGY